MTKVIKQTVQYKYYPNQDYQVEVVKDQYIKIDCTYENRAEPKPTSVTFKLGDEAEYDRWNLIYTGKIVKITDKTVTIDTGTGRNKRLVLGEFCHKNWGFDAKAVADHNHEEMHYI